MKPRKCGSGLASAALAATLSLAAPGALAQSFNERFWFATEAVALAVPQAAADTLRAALARIPFPRSAPQDVPRLRRAATDVTGSNENVGMAPAMAYAAEPMEISFPILRPTQPGISTAVPDMTALPKMERRYHVRRVPIPPEDLVVLIENKAIAHGVPLEWAHAFVRVESDYDPRLSGRGGTLGLMQIKHATALSMGFAGSARDLFDPATNLEWGMRYLAGARKLAKGDLCGTVIRYQGGHGALRMSQVARTYCGKVRALVGRTEPQQIAGVSAQR